MKLSELYQHPSLAILCIQLVLAYEWLHGAWEKLHGGVFVGGIVKALSRFEVGNPHTWYVRSFLSIAKNYPELFGQLVQWGELLVGIGLVVVVVVYAHSSRVQVVRRAISVLAILALLGGAWMNANFYFAAGWTSPSTSGLNVLMFWVQLILVLFWIGACSKNILTESGGSKNIAS